MELDKRIMLIYLTRYPHLRHLMDNDREFAKAAIVLAAPKGISGKDLFELANVAK